MTRAMLFALALGGASFGCASLGAEAAFPDPIQTSGVGPFRPLDAAETGLEAAPAGRVLALTGATGGGMRVGERFFHARADALAEPPERDETLPATAVDWARFGPRRIERARRGPAQGMMASEVALEAGAAWEGDAVFDPWVVLLEDGRARLYYAAAGGIGLAEAPSVDGVFSRVGDAPLLEGARGPTVVEDGDGGWLMYFEQAGGIGLATSSDGRDFTVEIAQLVLDRRALAEDDPEELSFHRPGAVWATTPADRRVLRLYFEVWKADGTFEATMAASLDGRELERLEGPVYGGDESTGAPAPFLTDDGATLLYFTLDHAVGGEPVRAPVVGVTPTITRFD
ncbi:MAG: hypothetical protein KF901_23500 [Myxococcales bacterium]|nr:hypothetical protein [Myxococcales bacterium]